MVRKKGREIVIQWIGVIIALFGLAYTGVKDYQKGDIKLPQLPQKQLTKVAYPVQYCLVAYDPNINKFFYLHENGIWHEYPPQLRQYDQQQNNQNQSQTTVANAYGTQGRQGGYVHGQQAQTPTNTQRY